MKVKILSTCNNYVPVLLIYVIMQQNYVDMQYNYVNMRDNYVNMQLKICCMST